MPINDLPGCIWLTWREGRTAWRTLLTTPFFHQQGSIMCPTNSSPLRSHLASYPPTRAPSPQGPETASSPGPSHVGESSTTRASGSTSTPAGQYQGGSMAKVEAVELAMKLRREVLGRTHKAFITTWRQARYELEAVMN